MNGADFIGFIYLNVESFSKEKTPIINQVIGWQAQLLARQPDSSERGHQCAA